MSPTRIEIIEDNLDRALADAQPAPVALAPSDPLRPGSGLTARKAVELFEDMCLARALDVVARELKVHDASYYTIGSLGHEMNALLGAQLRLDDPCFLHYRSASFVMSRSRQAPGETPTFDTLLGICASSDDPISGGRHKVWGSKRLWIPPQTSTIASHVPKAVGMAFAICRARALHMPLPVPADAIVACSFGDASANHATALAGINSARYASMVGNPLRVLFVCEDNRRGISVETPRKWIGALYEHAPELEYFEAKRGHIDEAWDTVHAAITACRRGVPVFLHLRCVRLAGHAGSDVETSYRSKEEIEETERKDPLLATARRLIETGAAPPETLRAIRADTLARVRAAGEEASHRPKLTTREQVRAPLAPYDEALARARATEPIDEARRREVFGRELPEETQSPTRRTLGAHINACLHDLMIRYGDILVMGEDVGKKGGVYNLTTGLQKHFKRTRVFDTILDETTILGLAQGAAQLGFLPIPEIQYLAYLHNAIDQLRGEACSLSFFSQGQFQNPMVVRVAAFGYQKGFGGHFHNDNAIAALRELPGILLATPSRGDDAVRMLRGCVAIAQEFGRVVCFLEPIALYHMRDLYEQGDNEWLTDYPRPGEVLLLGEVGVYGAEHQDVLLVSYANGLRLSLRAARKLEQKGIRVRTLDLRWLAPLPFDAVLEHAEACAAVVVVDECRATGAGVADAILARLAESGYREPMGSVRSDDTYIPLGPAAEVVLVSEDDIVRGVEAVLA